VIFRGVNQSLYIIQIDFAFQRALFSKFKTFAYPASNNDKNRPADGSKSTLDYLPYSLLETGARTAEF
jgi:hypothetical protein